MARIIKSSKSKKMKTKTGKEDFQNMRWNIMKTLKELKKSGSKDLKGIKIGKNKLKV